jgi:heat shock protein HslJ
VTDRSPEPSPLAETTWDVATIAGVAALADATPAITFGGGGRVTGTTGANRFTGSWTLVGDELTFGPLATTRRSGTPAVMEQQQRLLHVLQRPSRIHLEGPDLVLTQEQTDTRLVRARDQVRAEQEQLIVRGTVSYRERVPVPVGAEVVVRLLVVPDDDTPTTIVAEHVVRDVRHVPVRFSLAVPRSLVDPDQRLSLSARIARADQVLWASDRMHPVLTRGAPDLAHLVLRRLIEPG